MEEVSLALINCSECNNEISDKASSCPKCGAPTNKLETVSESSCPFCSTGLSSSAITCSGCGAEYGFYNHISKKVSDTSGLKFASVILLISILIFYSIKSTVIYALVGGFSLFIFNMFIFPPALTSKIRGEKWWKGR